MSVCVTSTSIHGSLPDVHDAHDAPRLTRSPSDSGLFLFARGTPSDEGSWNPDEGNWNRNENTESNRTGYFETRFRMEISTNRNETLVALILQEIVVEADRLWIEPFPSFVAGSLRFPTACKASTSSRAPAPPMRHRPAPRRAMGPGQPPPYGPLGPSGPRVRAGLNSASSGAGECDGETLGCQPRKGTGGGESGSEFPGPSSLVRVPRWATHRLHPVMKTGRENREVLASGHSPCRDTHSYHEPYVWDDSIFSGISKVPEACPSLPDPVSESSPTTNRYESNRIGSNQSNTTETRQYQRGAPGDTRAKAGGAGQEGSAGPNFPMQGTRSGSDTRRGGADGVQGANLLRPGGLRMGF